MEIGDVSKISLVYIWIMQKLVLPSSHSGNNSRQSAENQGNTRPSAAELQTAARLLLCDCGHVARVLSHRRSFGEITSHICCSFYFSSALRPLKSASSTWDQGRICNIHVEWKVEGSPLRRVWRRAAPPSRVTASRLGLMARFSISNKTNCHLGLFYFMDCCLLLSDGRNPQFSLV